MNDIKMKAAREAGRGPGGGNTSLLRVGVLCLSVVSFFTTANGMRSYIFTGDNSAVAYAASAAIQSILLALSMNLPKYLQGIWNSNKEGSFDDQSTSRAIDSASEDWSKKEVIFRILKRLPNYLKRLFLCGAAIALTLVTILCSSWFSYVYIAEVIHTDSWSTDSELLVQQTYRTELYNARDYAHVYRTYLEECVGEDISKLEEQAEKIADSASSVTVTWSNERTDYMSDNGTAASYMSPVITAMENAMREGASQESRDLAAIAISNATENIENRIEIVQTNLNRINANLTNYNSQISNLTSQINAATDETDVASLNASINSLTELISSETQRQINLQQENTQLDRALLRLPFYESLLGLSSSTSSIAIRTQLIAMQSEFFKPDPDGQALVDTATGIFGNLRSAATAVASGATGQAQNSLSYTNLLVQMNRLLRNLTDYSEVKAIEANLDGLIADLHTTSENGRGESDTIEPNSDGTTPGENDIEPNSEDAIPGENNTEPNPDDTTPGQGESETASDELPTSQNEGGNSNIEGIDGQEPLNTKANSEKESSGEWQEVWYARLEALKAQISAMPVYRDTETTAAVNVDNSDNDDNSESSENIRVLTDSQQEVLRSYDRNASSAVLDEMVRRYISKHNAIYQGLIYLASPYKMLAVFALCLALSFDLSGFVFGVVMQGEPQQNENEDNQKDAYLSRIGKISGRAGGGSGQAEWSILSHLHSYRVLTGDFRHKGDTYYYQVFRDGLAEQWPVKEANGMVPYKQGIYLLRKEAGTERDEDGGERGILVTSTGQGTYAYQELRYSGQAGGPQDGVFENCFLIYEDGGLCRQEPDGSESFVCSLEEYVPVHCYDPLEKENRTFPVKMLKLKRGLAAKIVVVALNKKGTRVSAIYVIKGNGQKKT